MIVDLIEEVNGAARVTYSKLDVRYSTLDWWNYTMQSLFKSIGNAHIRVIYMITLPRRLNRIYIMDAPHVAYYFNQLAFFWENNQENDFMNRSYVSFLANDFII
jgi:hypothetical protein